MKLACCLLVPRSQRLVAAGCELALRASVAALTRRVGVATNRASPAPGCA